jgi:hypothetical protein
MAVFGRPQVSLDAQFPEMTAMDSEQEARPPTPPQKIPADVTSGQFQSLPLPRAQSFPPEELWASGEHSNDTRPVLKLREDPVIDPMLANENARAVLQKQYVYRVFLFFVTGAKPYSQTT